MVLFCLDGGNLKKYSKDNFNKCLTVHEEQIGARKITGKYIFFFGIVSLLIFEDLGSGLYSGRFLFFGGFLNFFLSLASLLFPPLGSCLQIVRHF